MIKNGLTFTKKGDKIRAKETEKDNMIMNNTGMINSGARYGTAAGRTRTRIREVKEAPAWLVAICRLILMLDREETRGTICSVVAVGAVALLAFVAGAMSFGAVPLLKGIVICAALSVVALFATRNF